MLTIIYEQKVSRNKIPQCFVLVGCSMILVLCMFCVVVFVSGEIQLRDAMGTMMKEDIFYGVRVLGNRYDTGKRTRNNQQQFATIGNHRD